MIQVENLSKIYFEGTHKESIAVKNVSLSIEKSGLYILKGASGSGKSTLLSILGALNKPTSGKVSVLGENIAKLPDHFASKFRQEKLGFIFQQYHLMPQMSAIENIVLPLVASKTGFKEAIKNAQTLLKKLSLEKVRDTEARLLSGGEQQRVAVARALINNPKVILADEPTANLDSKNKQDLIAILNELKDEGRTIVVATHDEAFINSSFTEIFHMHDGEIVDDY